MDWNLYIAFVLLSLGIIALLGPNVLFIVATSLSSGWSAGLLAVLALFLFVLAVMLDSLYAIRAAAVKRVVDRPLYARGRNLMIGVIYLGASLGFALTRRTAA